ncbi:beta-galactoside alpha-2,6-sialyltransferase 2 [Malaya genurostris]|uniref:beta-galactoside alpha-2,6-sialyltransferase 2 n=1 Tax=Malaya genurostris TaxID=325434 RepID=UPI0026F3AF7D|nr:beta-galactoside alpha-2,6-sialyltransferase 2 [Malaya genurostris]XP_058461011.1 beta-galactoside alpha-2,6-sialyltransferase 2 [Malaya genurostris]XP_058461012.1 beta-galactoside alpha-2,6-sialyltransferase 2 [Malaya genurostris]XP_058461014.1 beta-galactoside alpha-2,6-sialyltransferase 2 [Malaya genurostris]
MSHATMSRNKLNDACYLMLLVAVAFSLVASSHHSAKHARKDKRSVFYVKYNSSERLLKAGSEKPSVKTNEQDAPRTRPHFSVSKTANVAFDPVKYACDEPSSTDCINKTRIFKSKVISEFRRVLKESFEENDYYQVRYQRVKSDELDVCRLRRASVRTVSWRDSPFDWNEIGSYIPVGPLFSQRNASCAVIASAGSLKGSKLGTFIDQHDIVMRFNNAPTRKYEMDVGSKTTVRVVNSQVVSKPEFKLLTAKLFRNISIAAWDPGKFNQSLKDWIKKPDFNLFENFKKYHEKYSGSNFHLVDPRSIWRAWTALQDKTDIKIMRNPPTSGFIGLGLLMPACRFVDMIEYIPSSRMNGLCHYYDSEINSVCTFGSWHPLAAEKLFVLRMNNASDFNTFQRGIVRIRLDSGVC